MPKEGVSSMQLGVERRRAKSFLRQKALTLQSGAHGDTMYHTMLDGSTHRTVHPYYSSSSSTK